MSEAILVLNSDSSGIKFTVYDCRDERLERRYDGQIVRIDTAPHLVATNTHGRVVQDIRWHVPSDQLPHQVALWKLGAWLRASMEADGTSLLGVGHRVAHGGSSYRAPVVLSEAVLTDLERLIPLAPLHQPHNLI